MPLKDYVCTDCGFTTEVLIRSSADLPEKCPSCDSAQYVVAISSHGGYSMASGPSSVRPRRAGSFKRSK